MPLRIARAVHPSHLAYLVILHATVIVLAALLPGQIGGVHLRAILPSVAATKLEDATCYTDVIANVSKGAKGEVVFCQKQGITGTIPASIATTLPGLKELDLSELGKPTGLKSLWLNENDLSGCVPMIRICAGAIDDETACSITSGDTNRQLEGHCPVNYLAFLRKHDLHDYHEALKAEGANEFSDLLLLTDEDIFALRGMKRVHARKLLNAIAPHRGRVEL